MPRSSRATVPWVWLHSRQHPGILEKGKGQRLCWGQVCAKCRLQGSRTFDEGGGV